MPGLVQSPEMLRTLLPLDCHVPVSANHLPPRSRDSGSTGKGFHVVHHGGLVKVAMRCRIGRAISRAAALAFQRLD